MDSVCDLSGELVKECSDILSDIERELSLMSDAPPGNETRTKIHRLAHTAKGLIGFLRTREMNRRILGIERTLRRFRDDEQVVPTPLTIESLETEIVRLKRMLHAVPDGDEPMAATTAARTEALTGPVQKALEGFGVSVSFTDGAAAPSCPVQDATGLTVVADLGADANEAIVACFDSTVAHHLGRKVASVILGEEVKTHGEDDDEIVKGALGELVNYIAIATLAGRGLPPEAGAPRFISGGHMEARLGAAHCVTVETDLGVFWLGLVAGTPLLNDSQEGSSARDADARRRGNVVIADDSMVMRKTIGRVLVRAGYNVVGQAANGQEAVEEFRRHRPDLVTMDINMPVMGGLDALRIIRAEDPLARVLMCSAIAEGGVVKQGLDSGAVGYITKPFKPETLLEAVEYLMKEGAAKSKRGKHGGSSCPEIESLGIYRVEKLLGEGGMALVYKAYDPGLGRGVALKVIRDKYAHDVDLVVRFLEEARAVARVNHANVVSVYFAGSDQGRHFFAMELLPGPDLEEFVFRKGPLTPREAFSYIRQGAAGLAAAAEKGLIHCDVKPSNLVFGADGMVKVTDFGIAQKAGTEENPTISEMVGTPCFMSPDQVLAKPIDHRADIYSLGATLYYLLTGEPPYDGDDGAEVALRQVNDPVPQIPEMPRKLNRLLAKMMAKSPDARHATYEDLASDIDRLL
jgi:CheY-like chemotaxis protein